jgi:hypothetical protein
VGDTVPMGHTSSSFTGQRVRWCGPTLTDEVSVDYRRAVDAGERRPPTRDERRHLAPGDLGTVGPLVDVGAAGAFHVVRFDNGVEQEIALPGAGHALEFIDHPSDTAGTGAGTAAAANTPHDTAPASSVRRWLRTLLGYRAPRRHAG